MKLFESIKSVVICKICATKRSEAGFIALISVLIISALVLLIAIGVSLRSVGETNIIIGEESSHKALSLANICAETALMKLESILNYAGNEIINIGSDSCYIYPVEGTGNLNRIIKTQSTVFGYIKKVKLVVARVSPDIQISSWEEVADF